ncbi:MAG: hypothetical protein AAGJ82_14325 [Bacteroidota bacterium]
MRRTIFLFFSLLCATYACTGDAKVNRSDAAGSALPSTAPTEAAPVAEATTPPATAPDEVPVEAYATTARRPVLDWSPYTVEEAKVEFGSAQLGRLCTNKFGCVQSTLYPLGWSEDGKFAYLIKKANEAVEDLHLILTIQDMESDEVLASETFKASDLPNFREEKDLYTVVKSWEYFWPTFAEQLTAHDIREGTAGKLLPLPYRTNGEIYDFQANNQEKTNDLFAVDVVDRHELIAICTDVGQKRILNHQFGKYDLALRTQALGLFRSPFEARVAVVDGWEKRGYEGPPNVLAFQLVGCKLGEGFE